ncbi:MAG: biotin synthase BioB [Nitrincola lacisaponensis]|uniref:Biotin synthase n=1 Tax=Nitrincola lacisaponensis TaxID=267850 RepID=A0A063Y2Y6_9GAMM|nr:biotin synthase BioB [Nitrincola lacisaponensis]KDE39495.1 Biotin synthase [Nitrincola lacisaponensis]
MIQVNSVRHDWSEAEIAALFELPFNDLMFQAQSVHRQFFDANAVQISTLLSIKTGACPEDCKYCPQSIHHGAELEAEKLMQVQAVLEEAQAAQAAGASRFCMGAAWKHLRAKDMPYVLQMIRGVKALGLETCMTLGMLKAEQAQELAEAGLDYYNHNLDTSEAYYGQIITTRRYQDRLDTLSHVRSAGMKVCCGGILGMGESRQDRISLLKTLACFPEHPESVPVNLLVRVAGTPLEDAPDLDPFEFIRTLAVARILMPASHLRLSAGRTDMNEQMQALCFMAGANSIFYGERLLTTENPQAEADKALFARLGLYPEEVSPDRQPTEAQLLHQIEAQQDQAFFYDAMSR